MKADLLGSFTAIIKHALKQTLSEASLSSPTYISCRRVGQDWSWILPK